MSHGIQRGRVANEEEEEDEEETDGVVGVGEGLEQKMSSRSSRRAGPDSANEPGPASSSRAKQLAPLHEELPVPADHSSVDTDEEAFLDPVTLCLLERPVTLTCGHNVSKAVLKDMRRLGLRRCPSCQAETISANGPLQVNLLLQRTIEALFPGKTAKLSEEELRREQCEEEAEERALAQAKAQRGIVTHEDFGPHTDWQELCGAEVYLPASLYEPDNQPCCSALAYALSHQRLSRTLSDSSANNHSPNSPSSSTNVSPSSSPVSPSSLLVEAQRSSSSSSSSNSTVSTSSPSSSVSSSGSSSGLGDEEDDCARLELLDLAHTAVGPAGIMALCGALLSGVVRVEQLCLGGYGITDVSMLALVDALRSTKAAQHVDIFRFCIRGKMVSDAGVVSMVRAVLSEACSLDDVRLESETLTDQALTQLSKALRSGRCPHLSFLSLSGRGLASGVVELSKALSKSPLKLEALSLPELDGSATMRDVANLLRVAKGKELKRLVLHGSQVGEAGTRALVQALLAVDCPPRLSNLILNDVSITDTGALALADIIASGACPQLKTIVLRDATEGDLRLALLEKLTRAQWYCRAPPQLLQRRSSPRLRFLLEQQHVRVPGSSVGEGVEVAKAVHSMAMLTDDVLLAAVPDNELGSH